MTNDPLEALLAARLTWAWDDGSPVAGGTPAQRAEMAAVARRRWYSYERRRSPKIAASRANRVEDLARGLCELFERGGIEMAGPLLTDYRWLAEQLADVFPDETTA